MTLSGKHILLGISGGIAAYKGVLLLRGLQKKGADVTVVMTGNAKQFVTTLTFETLSKNPVYSEMFDASTARDMEHIALAKKGDMLIVAPATANIIGKFAHGIADDLLSTLFLSFTSPVLIAPSMNTNMYFNTAVQENIAQLKKRGITIIEPEKGKLACGDTGAGRMAEVDSIIHLTENILSSKGHALWNKKIVITAGPTKEPLDPVRYITNASSGKMGYALAEVSKQLGGDVVLISGPVFLPAPDGVSFIKVNTCKEMREAVLKNLDSADIVIMCAAVCDFRPEAVSPQKIKKGERERLTIQFKKNPDIISEVCKRKKDQLVVGFAAETVDLIANAKKKLKEKGMDFIVANQVGAIPTGFDSDVNKVTIIDREMNVEDIPELSKKEVAYRILGKIINRLEYS